MKREDLLIRDPYLLVHEGKYYLYGTRSLTSWKKPDDLINWSETIEVFKRPNGFWSNQNF